METKSTLQRIFDTISTVPPLAPDGEKDMIGMANVLTSLFDKMFVEMYGEKLMEQYKKGFNSATGILTDANNTVQKLGLTPSIVVTSEANTPTA